MKGTLFIVATPIGNLEDITLRALKTLREADLILTEDTRVSSKLLQHFSIKKPLLSFNEHSRLAKIEEITRGLQAGKRVALMTDAGTPALADPGGKLVRRVVEQGIAVVPLPGPSALTAAVSVAGIPMNNFLFLGFLPKKGRGKTWRLLKGLPFPLVVYESPYRLIKTLREIKQELGDRYIIVGREISKLFEEFVRGKVEEVLSRLGDRTIKGEITVVIDRDGKKKKEGL